MVVGVGDGVGEAVGRRAEFLRKDEAVLGVPRVPEAAVGGHVAVGVVGLYRIMLSCDTHFFCATSIVLTRNSLRVKLLMHKKGISMAGSLPISNQ